MKTNIFDFFIIFLVISYDYLRMLGMNNKLYLFIYLFFLFFFSLRRIIYSKMTKKELLHSFLLLFFGLFSTIYIGEVNLIITILISLYFIKIDDVYVTKFIFKSSVFWYILVILLYCFGFAQNHVLVRESANSIIYRNSLGFSHVNQTFLYFLGIVFSSYILFFDKNHSKYNIFIFLISTILYIITNCRTGYFSVLIFLFIINFNSKRSREKLKKYIIPMLFLLFTVLTVIVVNKYGQNGSNKLNTLLSLRPFYLDKYISTYGLFTFRGGLFKTHLPMDNMYIYLLLEKGIFIYLFYLIIYYLYYKKNSINIKYYNLMLIFLIYGLFEAYIVLPSINFIFIFILKKIISGYKERE